MTSIRQQTRRSCAAVFISGTLFIAVPAADAAVSYSNLYVFGDSLTDSGNASILTGGLVPPAAYTDGTFSGRFTNGLNSADVLANHLFSTTSGLKPSFAPGGGTNYAVGGAFTGTGNVADSLIPGFPPTGMKAQLNSYLSGAGSHGADSGALYLVYGGANDMIGMLGAAAADPLNAVTLKNQAISTAIGNLGDILGSLAGAGAKSFLVPNLPDLGEVPRFVGGPLASFAELASVDFNTALDGMISAFDAAHPGVKLMELDTFAGLNEAIGSGAFSNTTGACYPGSAFPPPPSSPTCNDPDQHIFWDDLHPTSAAHALLGAEAFAVVTVPEPQTWMLLALGLAFLVQVACRRRVSERPSASR